MATAAGVASRRSGEEHFTTEDTALAAHVAEEVLARDLEPEDAGRVLGAYALDAAAQQRLHRILRHFATENPYQRDWIPLFSDYRRDVVQYRVSLATEARNGRTTKG